MFVAVYSYSQEQRLAVVVAVAVVVVVVAVLAVEPVLYTNIYPKIDNLGNRNQDTANSYQCSIGLRCKGDIDVAPFFLHRHTQHRKLS